MNIKLERSAKNRMMSNMYDIVRVLAVVFLIVQIVVVSYIVFGRFVLNKTPRWGEQLSLLCMVWFSLLSASMAEHNRAHIGVKINKFFLPPIGLRVIDIVNYFIKLGVSIFMIFAGIGLTLTTQNATIPGVDISRSWLYLSVPISGACLFITLLFRIKEVFKWETR